MSRVTVLATWVAKRSTNCRASWTNTPGLTGGCTLVVTCEVSSAATAAVTQHAVCDGIPRATCEAKSRTTVQGEGTRAI